MVRPKNQQKTSSIYTLKKKKKKKFFTKCIIVVFDSESINVSVDVQEVTEDAY